METKDKIKIAMRILEENVDVVLVEGKCDFSEEVLKITGWSAKSRVEKATVSDKEGFVFSKELSASRRPYSCY